MGRTSLVVSASAKAKGRVQHEGSDLHDLLPHPAVNRRSIAYGSTARFQEIRYATSSGGKICSQFISIYFRCGIDGTINCRQQLVANFCTTKDS
jgi:hypothetical protein